MSQRWPIRATGQACPLMLAVLLAWSAGCAPKPPTVFDKPAIDQIHKLLVVPLQSPAEKSAGTIVSGMIAAQLQGQRLAKFTVVEPPALWRLRAAQPGPPALQDEVAVKVARDMGADAVLAGTAAYSIELAGGGKPRAARGSVKAEEYQRCFAARKGVASISVRILSASAGRAVYAHSAPTKGLGSSKLLADGAAKALQPLVEYLRSSRKE